MSGKPQTEYQKKTVSASQKGAKNHQWKGNKVQYAALHEWVRKNFGSPTTCEDCGAENLTGKKIHWAIS